MPKISHNCPLCLLSPCRGERRSSSSIPLHTTVRISCTDALPHYKQSSWSNSQKSINKIMSINFFPASYPLLSSFYVGIIDFLSSLVPPFPTSSIATEIVEVRTIMHPVEEWSSDGMLLNYCCCRVATTVFIIFFLATFVRLEKSA